MKTLKVLQLLNKRNTWCTYTANIFQYTELVKFVAVSVQIHFKVEIYARKSKEFKTTYLNKNYYIIIKMIQHYV
jgi:hypothetical protein